MSFINLKLILTTISLPNSLLIEFDIFDLILFFPCKEGFLVLKSINISLSKTNTFKTDLSKTISVFWLSEYIVFKTSKICSLLGFKIINI